MWKKLYKKDSKIEKFTCINKAPKAAHEASSLMVPTQTLRAAQSTKANP